MAKKLIIPSIPIQPIPNKNGVKYKTGFEDQSIIGNGSIKMPKPSIALGNITTTGVKAESYEHGLTHLFEFIPKLKYNNSYNYALLMREEDDRFTLYERLGQPCWGSMREYNKGTRPDDPQPGDLLTPDRTFPTTGKVEALSIRFIGTHSEVNIDNFNRYISEFVFNKAESPWSSILKDVELVIKNDIFVGCVFKDCHIDPTVLAQFLRAFASMYRNNAQSWCHNMDTNEDINAKVAFLAVAGVMYNGVPAFSKRVVLERFFNSNPFDLSNGGTLYDRESYNRPDRDYVFGGKNNEGVSISGMRVEELMEKYHSIMEKDDDSIKVA